MAAPEPRLLPITFDNVLDEATRKRVWNFVSLPGWEANWTSKRRTDIYKFFHKHYAGHRKVGALDDKPYDCAEELQCKSDLLYDFWCWLSSPGALLHGHRLVRCYANGMPFGHGGTVHSDDRKPNGFTTIFYPHLTWSANWGGDTLFYNDEETDSIESIYPQPNRICMFQGMIKHRAAGVERLCPEMRITLMFKTDVQPLTQDDVERSLADGS